MSASGITCIFCDGALTVKLLEEQLTVKAGSTSKHLAFNEPVPRLKLKVVCSMDETHSVLANSAKLVKAQFYAAIIASARLKFAELKR